VDADMLPVLWLPGPASAKTGTRRRPGSGVLHTDVGDLVSRVERLQQHISKHVPRRDHEENKNVCLCSEARSSATLNIKPCT